MRQSALVKQAYTAGTQEWGKASLFIPHAAWQEAESIRVSISTASPPLADSSAGKRGPSLSTPI